MSQIDNITSPLVSIELVRIELVAIKLIGTISIWFSLRYNMMLSRDLNSNARKEHEEQQEPEITADGKDGSPYVSIPTIHVNGEGNVDDQHVATGSQKPEDVVAQMGDNPTSIEEYCEQLISTAKDEVSARIIIFDNWVHFLAEVEKHYHKHLAKFKLDVSSVNHDFECIRRLHKELRMIAAAHRDQRAMAGLPLTSQGISSTSHQEQLPTLEFSRWVDHEQDTTQAGSRQIELPGNENTAMTFHEHQAQETEPTIPTDAPRNDGDEHQAPAEPRSVQGIAHNLEDRSAITPLSQIVSDHQASDTAAQSLNVLSTQVSSLDLSYARLRDDTAITMHHTAKLRDQLKNTADGLDIKIDVLCPGAHPHSKDG
ncbi:extra-large guanine nucleotide-binding protein 1 [Dorcoceras hygrometricum]|uniref:Extra-large guanine nucleotide-binding protein 1 n=1 Tax=Dorcoceras hygrometricum TaxID=472368 RepID=A0A2Z6ZZ38_9LAMI|nr:extra-large guanine nucleotide-binding protein 1 [Dorcoceras hygrometricum]